MTGTVLRSTLITPEGCAVVAVSRPAAWLVLTVRAGRGPASPAAPRPGTLRPDADRPVACWTGCHLAAARVKGASRPCGMACGPP